MMLAAMYLKEYQSRRRFFTCFMLLYMCFFFVKGGFPAWLLTENKDMIFRTSDPCKLPCVCTPQQK